MKQIEQTSGSFKKFQNEDIFILSALYLEELGDFNSSSVLFNTLYKETDKKEYLYRSLKNDLEINENKKVIKRVETISGDSIDDFELTRIKIMALVKEGELLAAKKLAKRLVDVSKSTDDYLLVSEIYVKLKEFDAALKYLEGAYIKEYNELILEKMAIILYVNLERKKDAIAQLETHSRIHGCSETICSKLVGFYSNDNNIEGLLATYHRLYAIDFDKDTAQKIIQIYAYKRDFVKMEEFLEKNRVNDEVLLQIYTQNKNYKKASSLAYEIYKESGDLIFLGQSAIFEYEGSENRNDPSMHKSVIKKLKEVIEVKRDGVYLNYLGYLLIDHDIDPKEGMVYVKEALKIEPNSPYFLDSLAWGYYKTKECEKADEVMKKVLKLEGGDNEEVREHTEKIKECLKNKKVKN
jgi:predicted Zn-dependent protease